MGHHHRHVTREDLAQLGFTPEYMRERHRIGRGGQEPRPEWRPSGQVITSPVHLWEVETARDEVGRERMGEPLPVHLFLWSVLPPLRPYLTRLGGVPWRPAARPWPTNRRGKPCIFVAQFCFADSRHLVAPRLPGDVLLVFFADWDSWTGADIVLEWSDCTIEHPMAPRAVPPQELTVPQLSGVVCEFAEYPHGRDRVDEVLRHRFPYLVAVTQATKIGRASFFIQADRRLAGEELLCTLSSVLPADCDGGERRATARWPQLDLERYATPTAPPDDDGWSIERMTFGDLGALYFWIDRDGRVRVTADSY